VNNPINLDAEGLPNWLRKNNQAVYYQHFLAAYSGASADNVSLGILEMFLFKLEY
jgi:hypothetical protein